MSPETTGPVRAGFIGVGNFVSGNHLPNMSHSRLWTIHAVCDINEANLRRATELYRPAVSVRDCRALLDDSQVEVVFVGTRHDVHERMILESARAGKDVFVEKPMSKTWEESRRIVQAVQEAGTRLMVGYNRRFSPALAAAKAAFQSRNRGKKAMLTYRAVDDATFWPRWPFDVKVGGGKVLSEACHFFDLLCWFLEDEPVAVQCAGGREDNNLIEVAFRNGSIACVISGGCGHDGFGKERLEVFCDGSTLMMDQFLELQLNGYDGWGDANFDMADDPYPDAGPGNTVAGYRERMLRWLKRGPTEEESRTKAYYSSMPRVNKGHFEELEAYARSIRSGGPSPCDEVDGARATAMSLKAIQSLEDGQRPQPISGEDYFLDLKRK